MSINYLNSNQLKVFPVTNKPSEPQSRLTTEYNITNLINRLLDKKSFVITDNTALDTDPLEFTINGYYISINSKSDILDLLNIVNGDKDEGFVPANNSQIFAAICIDNRAASDVSNSTSFQELIGTDYSIGYTEVDDSIKDKYTGVTFYYKAPNDEFKTILNDGNNTAITLFNKNSDLIKFFNGKITAPDGNEIILNNQSTPNSKFIYLCILEYVNNGWQIPRASKIRFNQWALEGLDDGDLDNPNTFRPEVNTGVELFEVTNSGILDLSTVNGVEVVTPEENSSKSVAVLNTDITLKAASNITFEIVPNTIDLAGHTLVIEGGEDSKVANFEVEEDTEGKVVLKNMTVLGVEQ